MQRKGYDTTPVSHGIGVGVSKMLQFYVKVFYVMGKMLLGKLSCIGTGLIVIMVMSVFSLTSNLQSVYSDF